MKTVLVVDDEWVVAEVLEDVLVEAGYRVVTATNGRTALERVKDSNPDLIMLDYMMPLMDGAAVIAALSQNEQTRHIPVILMTSLPENAIQKAGIGYAGFLQKPFLDTQLMAMVQALLDDAD